MKKQGVETKSAIFKEIPTGESINLDGIGNATAGTLDANGIKTLSTKNDNKLAFKVDLNRLVIEINRHYNFVKNIPSRNDGALPYYDLDITERNDSHKGRCHRVFFLFRSIKDLNA